MNTQQNTRRLPPLGLQPIIFGNRYDFGLPDQLEDFLKTVAGIGFANVEAFPADPQLFNELGNRYGVGHAGIHLAISGTTDTEKAIRCLEVTGARDVCNSGLLKWGDLTAEDYYAAIPILNRMGSEFAREGIAFHYHNHEFEFKKVEGDKTGMDILMDGLDFSVIDLCVDVAWVHRGGDDPSDFLRRHQDKISYIHLKDTDADHWRELGRGVLDWKTIIRTIEEMPNVRWAVVEQDKTDGDPVESCRISREFLKTKFGY
jgi:sugar phosphate isomerase/epimerase